MKKYTVKLIAQLEGSLCLRLPDKVINEYGFDANDHVELTSLKKGVCFIKPRKIDIN
ncbi:hypothetical protein [Plebeiibacterium sediminum]|uniref:hypothetical protein n=1 Tax=Plebeiibacterium sediminum TaxID=2992112 RepID=UPI00263A88DE|nr:hypothetical protein [Plebeiobacterium sediminum]